MFFIVSTSIFYNCTFEDDIYLDKSIDDFRSSLIQEVYLYKHTFPKNIPFFFNNIFFKSRDFSNEVLTYSNVILNNSFVLSPDVYADFSYKDSIGAWVGSRIISSQNFLEITDTLYALESALNDERIEFGNIDSVVSLFLLSDVSERVMTIKPKTQLEQIDLRFHNRKIGIEIFAIAHNKQQNVQQLLNDVFQGKNSSLSSLENRTVGAVPVGNPVYHIREFRDSISRILYSGENIRPSETMIFKSSSGISNLPNVDIDSIRLVYLNNPSKLFFFYPNDSYTFSLSDSVSKLSMLANSPDYSMFAKYKITLRNLIELRYSWILEDFEKIASETGVIYYDSLFENSETDFANSIRLIHKKNDSSKYRYNFFNSGRVISQERVINSQTNFYDSLFIMFPSSDTLIYNAHRFLKFNENDSINLFINVNRKNKNFSGVLVDKEGVETLFKSDSLNPMPI